MDENTVESPKSNTCYIGADLGTMFIVISRSDRDDIRMMRNMFLELDSEEVEISELSDMNYVKNTDGKLYILGDDAFKYANIFGKEASRPMQNGLISSKEIGAIDVLTLMLKNLIGDDLSDKEVYCSYSVPAEAIDDGKSVIYHERVFRKIFNTLKISNKAVNEAMAIIYSECANEKFSGISVSMGSGMCNTCLSFKGIEVIKFSTARAGDYIDNQVAAALNMIPNRVTVIKENYLDLSDSAVRNSKKNVERVLEALRYYYESTIDYTVKKMIKEFNEKIDIEIDSAIPIVVAGGTSMPKGTIELFETIFKKYDFPIQVSEVRRAKNPMTAVSQGLLIKTIADMKK